MNIQQLINEADCPDNLLTVVRKYYDASYNYTLGYGHIRTKDFVLTFSHGTKWVGYVLAHHGNTFLGAYEHQAIS